MILYNSNFSEERDNNNRYDFISLNFLQNSYAIESDEKDENNNKDTQETKDEDELENNNKGKTNFNIVAVGDWDCTGETEDTCLLYTSPSPRDRQRSRMPSSA